MTRAWRLSPARALELDRPRLLAIVNLTPDSFSDGGALTSLDLALAFMRRAIDDGADMLDVGGESTRPGSAPVDEAEQVRRVVPVIEAARRAGITAPISIDTTRAQVARAALDAGADVINDTSAGADDPDMLPLASSRSCGVILTHRPLPARADHYAHQHPAPPRYDPAQGGVVGVVRCYLEARATAAIEKGVAHDAIVIDPGLGFAKNVAQNFELIRRTSEIASLGLPVLSAASRKSFIGAVAHQDDPVRRDAGSVAISVAHFLMGVRLFRVHDVAAHAQALRVAASLAE